MQRTFVFIALISFVLAFKPPSAHAGILSKLFGELFSSSASKSASEVGQAAVRKSNEAVPAPKSRSEDQALEAGQFVLEEAAGNVAQEGVEELFSEDRPQSPPY